LANETARKEAIGMTERTRQHEFVKLSDSDFRLQASDQDIRGLDVYDTTGNQIGHVEDLYVDDQDRKVRFLDVGAGGLLGVGKKHFLIPVEAIADVGEGRVTIDENREKVVGSPAFDPNVVPEPHYHRDLYDYYGYPYYPL
jgi:sporulation protein YlmC with PRC-barrel domain